MSKPKPKKTPIELWIDAHKLYELKSRCKIVLLFHVQDSFDKIETQMKWNNYCCNIYGNFYTFTIITIEWNINADFYSFMKYLSFIICIFCLRASRTNEDAWNGYNQRPFCFKAKRDHHFNCCKLFFCRVAVIYRLQESSEHYWLQTQSLCNHPVLTVCPKRKKIRLWREFK